MKCNWISDNAYSLLRGKSVLVAGGTGFVGQRTVEMLDKIGMRVYVITRRRIEDLGNIHYLQGDLSENNDLQKINEEINEEVDYGIYMAANIPLRGQAKENYFDAKKSTFDPFINFCEQYLPKIKSFVYISSVDVLGGCAEFEYNEIAPIRVASPYGLAKYIGELYTKDICTVQKIPYTILRFAQVYGPNEPIVRIIPIIKKAMTSGNTFTLVTDGSERRRFLYVDDAVKSIIHGLIYASNETYNIAGPDYISMKDLVSLIERIWGKKIDLVIKAEIKGEDNVPSIEKARRELKFNPGIKMRDGMQMIMEEERNA